MLVYVHGFNSSARSYKAGLLRERMAALGLAAHFACPELAHRPAQAIAQLQALLAPLTGPQKNLYTGEAYELTVAHVAELRALEVERITPDHYLLIAATGDEVLDYRDGVRRYAGCEQVIVEGSDHGFRQFADYLDPVIAFWQRGRV